MRLEEADEANPDGSVRKGPPRSRPGNFRSLSFSPATSAFANSPIGRSAQVCAASVPLLRRTHGVNQDCLVVVLALAPVLVGSMRVPYSSRCLLQRFGFVDRVG